MKIRDLLKDSKAAFPSLEIVPPLKGWTSRQLVSSIEPFMEFRPRYINVTCHRDSFEFRKEADGSFSRHLVRNRISEVAVCGAIRSAFDVDVVPHIICGGTTRDEIESKLYNLRFMGIENVVALRGDSMTGEKRFVPEEGGYRFAGELVRGIRSFERSLSEDVFSIGVGGYPEKHFEAPNPETDIERLKEKVDAGADYIITQMFFDNARFYDYVARCRQAGISVPIIPGLKPLSTARQIELLPETFSIDIPMELTQAVRQAGEDSGAIYRIGTEWCIAQCKDLLRHGVPAVHFYTMGKSDNITAILRECF